MSSLSIDDMHLSVPGAFCLVSHFPSCAESICGRSLQGSPHRRLVRHGSTASLGVHLCAASGRAHREPSLRTTDPSSEDSDSWCRAEPPTPPPRSFLRRHGNSFRLPCLSKQDSHEKPILRLDTSPSPSEGVMSCIAASLRFSPLPVMAVAGLSPRHDEDLPSPHPMDHQNHLPLHRASYHGHSKYMPEMNGGDLLNHMRNGQEERVIGSAENLVGRVLQEQGLGRYCDPEFVKVTQRELAEAINMTPEELDRAAHRLLQQQRRNSNPYLYSPPSQNNLQPPVPKQNEAFLSLRDSESNRPHSQQNYYSDRAWDDTPLGDTKL